MPSIFDSFDPPTTYAELAQLPTVLTLVTAATFRAATIFLSNVSGVDRYVTIQNGAGVVLVQDMLIPANTTAPLLQFELLKIVGIKWKADDVGVNGQIEGFPHA